MSKRDYYEVLGIDRGASPEQVKKAYRRLAHQFHPDKNPGDKESEERFKELSEAYETLGQPEKRAAYDRFGHAGLGRAAEGYADFGDAGFGGLFDDLFEGFFGTTGRRRSAAHRGADLRYNLTIPLEEAARGFEKEILVPRLEACGTCGGSGARPGSRPKTCGLCRGTGQVRFSRGFLTVSQPCQQCRGEGTVLEDPCRTCQGQGRVRVERSLSVKIPAGVETGTRLRVSGEGEAGIRGGARGDLYVVIQVAEHPLFVRDGDDLLCEVPISFTQAALGAELRIPTLSGSTKLKVPPGAQSGAEFRLRGQGMPSLRGYGVGDLRVRILVEVPTRLTSRQRQILEEFASLENGDGTPLSKRFLEKVRNLLGK
ncbi:MAG: molecular chaperone DnaJ [candidate division NC10 bacterium]|nr:molecular chaperone DnaJ [candidate division NC10 bacterium]